MRWTDRRRRPEDHFGIRRPDLQHRIRKGRQPVALTPGRLGSGGAGDLVEAAPRQLWPDFVHVHRRRQSPGVALDVMKPDDGTVVRIARDAIGQPQGAIGGEHRGRRGRGTHGRRLGPLDEHNQIFVPLPRERKGIHRRLDSQRISD